MTMDASDRDNMINIKSGWGTSAPYTPSYGMYTPDVVKSFSVGSTHYLITANEGDTRDGEDLIGISGDFEGEEARSKDTPLTCTNGCGDDEELGRVLTTTFMPSDYSANACGTQMCQAWQLNDASSSSFEGVFFRADYGGRNDIYGDTAHPDCGYAPMLAMFVDSMNKTGQVAVRPDTGGFPWGGARASSTGRTIEEPFSFPGWFSGTTGADSSITGPASCLVACQAVTGADHWSYEFEDGYHECFCKGTHTDADHCSLYTTWAQHWSNGNPWGQHWEGYSGATTFTAPAPYTTESYSSTGTTLHTGHGVRAGHTSVGARSFTIWSWDGQPGSGLVQVYDSGSEFETQQALVNNGLCTGCDDSSNAATCEDRCPFNSDDWPPSMDDRSDAKGPEPECVDTGVMTDGTRLAFIGLERTGGIMTYDITTPASSTFQDYLNVRNWRVGETFDDDDSADMVAKALNDGPESLIFLSAATSPIGRELLLAATPLAGRVTAYTIERGTPRGNDGSCATTAGCAYLSTTTCQGSGNCGSGEYRAEDGSSTVDVCDICVGQTCPPRCLSGGGGPPVTLTAEVIAEGDVSDYTTARLDAMKQNIVASFAGNGPGVEDIDISVASASVRLTITIEAGDAQTIESANTQPFLTAMSTATGAAALLSTPTFPVSVTSVVQAPELPSTSSSDSDDDGLPTWGAAVFAILGVLAICFCMMMVILITKEKSGNPVFMTMPAPATATTTTSVATASAAGENKGYA